MRRPRLDVSLVTGALWLAAAPARAGEATVDPGAAPAETTGAYETVVITTTPLHGSRLPRERVPANVQAVTAEELADQHSLDLSGYMNEKLGSVHVNDVAGNPLQPDLQYRGFLASPLLGAPQGLSMYLDGVRLNEPFGDAINWDLVPANAIRSVNVIPGSNPIFGLNTLGGALSLDSKTGFTDPGIEASLLYGSFGRKLARAAAGAHGERFAVFAAAQLLDEDGWRDASPTRSEQAMAAASYEHTGTSADLLVMGANTSLTGNGAAPEQLLAVDRRAVFTAPDRTQNRALMVLLRGERALTAHLRLSGTAHLRTTRSRSLNGDQRDWAACAAKPGFLCARNDAGAEAPVVDGQGLPVPFDAAYDASDNRSDTRQTSYGVTAQLAVDASLGARENALFVGLDADQSRIRFRSQSTVASLAGDRTTADTGFVDPTSPVAVDGVVDDLGIYSSDNLSLRPDLFLAVSGRFNLSSLSLDDRLGDELTGDHAYQRFNPAVGLSYQPRPWLGGYAGYSESNRAPTAIELTCASPTDPCRLPNAFVADPPLHQVVARTIEAGLRGGDRRERSRLDYAIALFRTTNTDDILFITSGTVANQGYFANVGRTQRQGIEADLSGQRRLGRAHVDWDLHYTLTDATFRTPFTALSATHPDASNGVIDVPAGAHIPSVPAHVGKAALTFVSSFGLAAGVNVIAQSGQHLRGDEANRLPALPGYAIANARLAYTFWSSLSAFVLVNNLFNANYATFGVLGDATGVLGPAYTNPRFAGPGAPRGAWVGLELRR